MSGGACLVHGRLALPWACLQGEPEGRQLPPVAGKVVEEQPWFELDLQTDRQQEPRALQVDFLQEEAGSQKQVLGTVGVGEREK